MNLAVFAVDMIYQRKELVIVIYNDKVLVNNCGSVVFCLSCYLFYCDNLMSYCKFCLYMNAVVIDDICFLCYCLKMRSVCYYKEIEIEMVICNNQNVFCIDCLVGWTDCLVGWTDCLVGWNIVLFSVVYICC